MKNSVKGITCNPGGGQALISGSMLGFVLFFLLGNLLAKAQGLSTYDRASSATRGVELAGLYGWQFGGSLNSTAGDVSINDSDSWGVELDITVPGEIQAVMLYYRQDSRLELKEDITGSKSTLFDMSVNYFQVGGMKGVWQGNIMPFGVFTLGATLFDPKNSGIDSEWLFSVNLGLGVKIYASERVGLRLQGNLLLPIQWAGGGLWCSSGSGCSASLSGGSAILQGFAGGGLFIVI